ncbi:MAG: hypothetical protein IJ072_04195 [Oscillospiraceae bacterium]|nr:hypothetical protein [Oscillospiraceae bacterium]
MLSREDMESLTVLAKLSPEGEDMDELRAQISRIVDFAGQIAQAPDAGFETAPEARELRDDIPAPSLPREAVLSNAAFTQGGYFVAEGGSLYDKDK